jgi:hydroxypyruvate isomerase
MLRFDANLRWMFTEVPMLERYQAAADAGFKGVEVAFPYDIPATELAQRLADLHLKLVQILSPMNWEAGERGIACLPERADDFKRSLDTAVEYSVKVGKPNIHPLAGNAPSDASRQRFMDTFLSNLGYAADQCKSAGLTVIIEPVCRARFPNFLYKTLEEGAAIIRQVGRDNVKLCFDTFHIQMEEGAITDHFAEYLPYIGHIQIGDAPGRNEPGTGEINFPYIFAAFERLGWDKWVGCEYAPSGHTLDALAWGAPYGVRPPPGHVTALRNPAAPASQRGWT